MNVLLLTSPDQDCQRIVDRVKDVGYQVFQAFDKDQACSIVEDDLIQAAVIDVGVDSQPVVEHLRRHNTSNYLYIFSLIHSPLELHQGKGAESYVDEFLVKPVEPDELIFRLEVVNRYNQTMTDIRTKRKYLQPIRDFITGTLSRTAILELIDSEISRCSRFSKPIIIALLELDQADEIQEDHGWGVFDRAMAQVGLKIWATVRKYDLIGRWSENRFMLILPETALSGAMVVAHRLQRNISCVPLILPDNRQQELSASIGFVQCDHTKLLSSDQIINSVENLLDRADQSELSKVLISRNS